MVHNKIIRGLLLGTVITGILLFSGAYEQFSGALAGQVIFPFDDSSSSKSSPSFDDGSSSSSAFSSSFSFSSQSDDNAGNENLPTADDADPNSFAACEGYEKRFPRDMNVPEGETLVQQWQRIFTKEMDRIVDEQLSSAHEFDDCREILRAASENAVHLVQQFECALQEESELGTLAAANVLERQGSGGNTGDGGGAGEQSIEEPGTYSIFAILDYVNATVTQIEQSRIVSANTLRYVLESDAFSCNDAPNDGGGRSQRSSSSSSASDVSSSVPFIFPPIDQPPPEEETPIFDDGSGNTGGETPLIAPNDGGEFNAEEQPQ